MNGEMLLMLDVRPTEEINLGDDAIVVIENLDAITEFILNGFDPMQVNHTWRDYCRSSTVWDEAKPDRLFLVLSIFQARVTVSRRRDIRRIIWRVLLLRSGPAIVRGATEEVDHGGPGVRAKRTENPRRNLVEPTKLARVKIIHLVYK